MPLEIHKANSVRIAPFCSVISAYGPHRSPHQGGPIWDDWDEGNSNRHCRRNEPIDDVPSSDGFDGATETLDAGYWCGPVVNHYGHQIADFGTRIPAYLGLHSPKSPLIFGAPPESNVKNLPTFFRQIMDWYRVPIENLRLVSTPVIVKQLFWAPQHEQLFDVPPTSEYVDTLTSNAIQNLSYPMKPRPLYVSRAGQKTGAIAGEAYLELFFTELGFSVIRPENISLREQLTLYQNAPLIVFSEGSALHTLQLLGRIQAKVLVITRRPRRRLSELILSSRIDSLLYIDAISIFIPGGNALGSEQPNHGIAFLNEEDFIDNLEAIGIDVSSWSRSAYKHEVKRSFARWFEFNLQNGYQRSKLPQESLLTIGLEPSDLLVG